MRTYTDESECIIDHRILAYSIQRFSEGVTHGSSSYCENWLDHPVDCAWNITTSLINDYEKFGDKVLPDCTTTYNILNDKYQKKIAKLSTKIVEFKGEKVEIYHPVPNVLQETRKNFQTMRKINSH